MYAFGESLSSISHWASIIGCKVGEEKLIYLGAEIGVSPSSIRYWDPLVSKVQNRLLSWEADHLSIAGRLVLLKASIDSLLSYWFNLFKMPSVVLNKLEQARIRFLWGSTSQGSGKLHLLNWEKVCSQKSVGGIGLNHFKG